MYTLFYIDDDLTAATQSLGQLNKDFSTIHATTQQLRLETLENAKPDAILFDYFTAAEAERTRELLKHFTGVHGVPLILLSAAPQLELYSKLFAFDGCIEKQNNYSLIRNSVMQFFSREKIIDPRGYSI
ncbi:MAG: hypothetical protein J7527_09900 [Chitinophagaceae bacterium]|nr:hypothetical protein [Chitinophagaceae bacterium]